MTPSAYIKKAMRTESKKGSLLIADVDSRILHGIMGVVTEAGELMDIIKRYFFYDKEPLKVHIIEEIGDVFWYLAILCDALEIDFEMVWKRNIAKLRKRYPEKFTSKAAINRDLAAERKELEK